MELIKKNIHMNKCICEGNLQFTLDSDINVTDSKPDIAAIIYGNGDIKVEEQHVQGEKLFVRGLLMMEVLYLSDDSQGCTEQMRGELSFNEVMNMSADCGDGTAALSWTLEDLSVSLVHSRKISVKALVRMDACVNKLHDEECIIDVNGSEDIQLLPGAIDITRIACDGRDTYRFKDMVTLPAAKAEIDRLLYCEANLNSTDIRLLDDKFTVRAELGVFFIYKPAGEDCTVDFYETVLPVNTTIDCSGCREDMIPDIVLKPVQKSFEVQADEDGEERVISLEVVFEAAIRVYEDNRLDIISDIYDPKKNIIPEYKETVYEKLLMRNSAKLWLSDTVQLSPSDPKVLQICCGCGSAKLDLAEAAQGGIQADGIAEIHIFYMSADEKRKLWCLKVMLPFSQFIEIKGMEGNERFKLTPALESVSAAMHGSGELEVKAGITLSAFVFAQGKEKLIVGCSEEELDYDALQEMPSMLGYVVKDGDTLWSISKKYRTTPPEVMSVNGLDSDKIKAGDKLLIVKDIGILS